MGLLHLPLMKLKMMSSEIVHLNTGSQIYGPPIEREIDDVPSDKPSVSTPPPSNGLHIEKPIPDTILLPPKSTLQNSILNPNTRVSQYYNRVEYLAQAPCAMSTLEVLQTCPTQRNNFLTSLGSLDPKNNNIIAFKLDDFKTRLSHQLDFQLSTKAIGNTIIHTILD